MMHATTDLQAAISRWLAHLSGERRLSPRTLEAYGRDMRDCLAVLAGRVGRPLALADVATLKPADIRAYMAARRLDGIGSRSLMRGLAAIRSALRYLEREGLADASALSAVRGPKLARGLPKPLPAAAARRLADPDLRAGEDREPWILVRDAAVLGLLYGCGLRISEALGLLRRDALERQAQLMVRELVGGSRAAQDVLDRGVELQLARQEALPPR
jgi:integrase/recombinase XerC